MKEKCQGCGGTGFYAPNSLGPDACIDCGGSGLLGDPDVLASGGVRLDAEPVAEMIACERTGISVREIDGRWKFLRPGDKLYAKASTGAAA